MGLDAGYRLERVGERGLGQRGRLLGGPALLKPGLRPAGHGCLGEHEDPHGASCWRMSLTASSVPRAVPVTFDRPSRGR